jgi:TetR/AcrR family tetracycline transcriptional repressor
VRAALALLDELGFDGLTMRNLAERLGVQAASLYNHIRDKQDVLTLVADAISGEVPRPTAGRPWRAVLEGVANDYRRVLLAHRDAARVLTVTPPLGPHRLRIMDDVLGALRSAGFSAEVVADAAWVFNTYVTGFVLDEQMQSAADPRAAEVVDWLKSLPAEEFPNIAAVSDTLFDREVDRRFQFGLRALLDGFAARPDA